MFYGFLHFTINTFTNHEWATTTSRRPWVASARQGSPVSCLLCLSLCRERSNVRRCEPPRRIAAGAVVDLARAGGDERRVTGRRRNAPPRAIVVRTRDAKLRVHGE